MGKTTVFDAIIQAFQNRKELRMLERNKKLTDDLLRKDWIVVKTLNAHWTNEYGEVVDKITFVLLENGLGERRSRHATTAYVSKYTPDESLRHGVYLKTVFPWCNGVNFADIPTYLDLKKANVR